MKCFPESTSGLLFDMDGVILDSMKYHMAAWREVLCGYGVVTSPEDIYRREGMSGVSSVKEIFIEKNVPLPEDRVIEELIEKKHQVFSEHTITLYDGIVSLLDMLKNKKLHLGLVTGSHLETVTACLPRSVREKFSVIVTADDVMKGKPSPEPYRKALEKISLKPEEALVVENAPMGIKSALNAGICCIAIETTLSEEYLKEADHIVKNHDELWVLLKELTTPPGT